jgi:rhodanese-related sulfurtransferase
LIDTFERRNGMPTEIGRDGVRRLVEQGAQLVEVLPAEEYKQEHLPGAMNLPLRSLTRAEAERRLRRDRPVIVYCNDYL